MASVLITDFDNRKALAAARNLGRHGVLVIGGSDDPTAIGRFSRYCSRFVRYPSPRQQPGDYHKFMVGFLREHAVDVLMPMDDETVLLAAEHRDEISRLAAVAVPALPIVLRARDKAQTVEWARRAGVRVPETWMPTGPDEVSDLGGRLRFPVLIKPRESSGSRGILRADTPEELVVQYHRVHSRFDRPLVQEYIPFGGGKYHVQLLMDANSGVVARFTHRVLREWPVHGGVGTFWVSCRHPEAEQQATKLLQTMEWGPGVAMTEFLIDPRTGELVLMEVNPRFWGTLQSSISAGVEFPYLLFHLALGHRPPAVLDYPTGVQCQWLLPGDALNFFFNPQRWRADPPYLPRRDSPRAHATLCADDPMPTLGFFVGAAYHMFDRGKWNHLFRKL